MQRLRFLSILMVLIWSSASSILVRSASADEIGTWHPLTPPAGRLLHQAIYDASRDRLVVFGGFSENAPEYRNDTWTFARSSKEWSCVSTLGPTPSGRYAHSAVWDPVRDRMLIFGGYLPSLYPPYEWVYSNDVWALNFDTMSWSQLGTSGLPPPGRAHAVAIYDPVADQVVFVGGDNSAEYVADVWTLTLSGTPTWSQVIMQSPGPAGRYAHTLVYDSVRRQAILFGGSNDVELFADTWTLSLNGTPEWNQIAPSGPIPGARQDHGAVYDPGQDRMVVFGGRTPTYRNDVWALTFTSDPPGWTQLLPSGTKPVPRSGMAAVYDTLRAEMVFFGGYAGGLIYEQMRDDTWSLSLSNSPSWQVLGSSYRPFKRTRAVGVLDTQRDQLIVWGGRGIGGTYADHWNFKLQAPEDWSFVPPSGAGGMYGAGAIYDPLRDRLMIIGGNWGCVSSGCARNDVWIRDLTTNAWTQLFPSGSLPLPRWGHAIVYDPTLDRILMFGGRTSSTNCLNDVWVLNLSPTLEWTQLNPTGSLPAGRAELSLIYDPFENCVILFGGTNSNINFNDSWKLSLSESPPNWTQLAPTGQVPQPRTEHTAVLDSNRHRMLVFGGGSNGAGGLANDVRQLDLSTLHWSILTLSVNPVSGRTGHIAVFDPVRDCMLISGGFDSEKNLNDVWGLYFGGTSGVAEVTPSNGGRLEAVPNPFTNHVRLITNIETPGRVSLNVFDVQGRLVRTLFDQADVAGPFVQFWDGRRDDGSVAKPGTYFVRMSILGAELITKKITLAR